MKKRFLSLTLALLMCLPLFAASAASVNIEGNYRLRWDLGRTSNNPAYVEWHVSTQRMQVTYINSGNFFQIRDINNPDTEQKSKLYVKEGETWTEIPGITSKIVGADGERSGTWKSAMYADDASYTGSPTYQTIYLQFFKDGQVFSFEGGVEYGIYFEIYTDGYPHGSMPDDIFGFGNPATSDWALGEVGRAEELGLIPDTLQGADLSQPITRAEFAAVCVKVYENLGNTTALPMVNSPFTDCSDVEVLKAYNAGITAGTGDGTTFSPDLLLNREQAATMLTRVFKRVTLGGWTLANDTQFPLTYEKPAAFSDDAQISAWAKDAVYFMAANGIIQGASGNFMPKAATEAEEAQGYAQATREQALIIAVRMVEKLG